MVSMSSRRSKYWWVALIALAFGAALRLWFIHAYPEVEGDTLMYGDIAKNWMLHGIYGLSSSSGIHPTLIRLPGYPLFLMLCFRLFGMEHYNAVMFVQTALDLCTCLLIAGFARRIWSVRAGWWALWLAALCPFTANYVAAPLTETPELFCIAVAFYSFARFIQSPRWRWAIPMILAWSYATLLRPDGALLAVVLCPFIVVCGARRWGADLMIRWAVSCAWLAVLPFVPWTLRNVRTFHLFQPLAPRYAVDPGEPTNPGFNRWTKTVCVDLTCTSDIYWNADTDVIRFDTLPDRAFDSFEQYQQTKTVIAEYNQATTITPQIDAEFAALAAQRIHDHPWRYYAVLPLARLADMAFRPRTDMLWIEMRWWQFDRHESESYFAVSYAALNLAYFLAALIGFLRRPPLRGAIVVFILVRSALLMTLEAPEPRYTLEFFPPLIALAAVACSGRRPLVEEEEPQPAEEPEPESDLEPEQEPARRTAWLS
jgi:hypothetical protein